MPNAWKTDGSELRNTLEGTERGKGAKVRNEVRKEGAMRNVSCRGERLGLSLCAVPSFNRTVVSFYLKGVGSTGRVLGRF